MKTTKLPHHARAEDFARALFSEPALPVMRGAMARASINLPSGLLAAVDAVAAQGMGGNRSAAVVKLLELGYGLLLEYLPPEQRQRMQQLVEEQAGFIDEEEAL